MKIKKITIFFIVLIVLFMLPSACRPKGVALYKIGEQYEAEKSGIRFRMENIKEKEMFVYHYLASEAKQSDNHVFYFSLNIEDSNEKYNSGSYPGFTITDQTGEMVIFDEDGYYYFDGRIDKVFYISYKDADERIKNAISNDRYTIYSNGTFIPN